MRRAEQMTKGDVGWGRGHKFSA